MSIFYILDSFANFSYNMGKDCSVAAVYDHEFLSCMFLFLQVFVFLGKISLRIT